MHFALIVNLDCLENHENIPNQGLTTNRTSWIHWINTFCTVEMYLKTWCQRFEPFFSLFTSCNDVKSTCYY